MATLPAGVPTLFGTLASLFLDPGAILTGNEYVGYGGGEPPLWGIFLNGQPVIIADTITKMSYKQDWAVANYPVERGGFESYDKVNTPYEIRLQFVAGGSIARRQALIDSIAAIGDTLTKYDVVTPEAIYVDVNVMNYGYQRAANHGLGLLAIDIGLLEIREGGSGDFKNPRVPSGYAADQAGNVQSIPPTEAVAAEFNGVV